MPASTQKICLLRSHDGVRLAYAASGRGSTVIKAATWLSHLEYDWESPVWRHVLPHFSSRHRLLHCDERGCGLSDWQVDDLGFESWVRDLEAVADEAGAEPFAQLGVRGAWWCCAGAPKTISR